MMSDDAAADEICIDDSDNVDKGSKDINIYIIPLHHPQYSV